VTPVALVASVFAQNLGKSFSELELKFATFGLMNSLEGQGAHLYVPRQDHDYAITVGLRMLILRDLALEADGLYYANSKDIELLQYYANSIAHFFDA
jgi:glycerol-3-phosphate O-acyltransferase